MYSDWFSEACDRVFNRREYGVKVEKTHLPTRHEATSNRKVLIILI